MANSIIFSFQLIHLNEWQKKITRALKTTQYFYIPEKFILFNWKGSLKSNLAKKNKHALLASMKIWRKGALLSAHVLGKLSNALEVTSDYMINGTSFNQDNNSLTDKVLLNQIKIIEKLPEQDKSMVKIFLDAFITNGKLKQLAL